MDNSVNSILEELKNKKISREVAKELLNKLKEKEKSASTSYKQSYVTDIAQVTEDCKQGDIAVIGISGQFPDADDIESFWENLVTGHNAIRELPEDYLNSENGSLNYKWGGILENRDCFDPLFFNIPPREAESMSSHQRLILQEGWRVLEDAGYNPKSLGDSNAGIFIGAEPSGYFHESFIGSSDAIVASRLSYYLDLKGPAIVVNTGCSSSGVAIHLACNSLRNGECSLALAGGVLANLNQTVLTRLADIGMLSPTGRCLTFNEAGDGTVLSEGVGIVLLKRLEDAVKDNDQIYGVIKGSGLNQDGASNGITAPNGIAQEQLIANVYKKYGINPEDLSYIEAHGTGTKLGDPVEANALVRAFRQFTDKTGFCAIGSAKSHIGHTSSASGVIGLIKVLLSMRYHKIPGLINFTKLNPLIQIEGSPFYINTQSIDWKSSGDKPLMAALNTFGHSGTNVHIVVSEYIPEKEPAEIAQSGQRSAAALVPISARTEQGLKAYVVKILNFLKATSAQASEKNDYSAELKKILIKILAENINVHENDIISDEAFADYGVEQIQLQQVNSRIQEILGIETVMTDIITCSSVNDLINYLTENYADAVQQYLKTARHDAKSGGITIGRNIDISDLAYTFQVGREAMKERIIFIAKDINELAEKMEAFINGNTSIAGVLRGKVRKSSDAHSNEEINELLKIGEEDKKLEQAAKLWVQGFDFSWQLLYGDILPKRISLPTYPFKKEKFGKYVKLQKAAEQASSGIKPEFNTAVFEKFWREQEPEFKAECVYTEHVVFVCEQFRSCIDEIKSNISNVRVISLESGSTDICTRFQSYAIEMFEEIKRLIQIKHKGKVLIQALVPFENGGSLLTGLSGILKTASLESTKLYCQLIEAECETEKQITNILVENSQNPMDSHIRYQSGKRLVPEIKEAVGLENKGQVCWKDNGIYLITGGAGGLGMIFAEEIATKTKSATLILTGRSILGKEKQEKLKQLEALGARVIYKQADISQRDTVDSLIAEIRHDFGGINGILHSAGVIKDNFIIKKSKDEFIEVLSPKVAGVTNLDEASKDIPMDFFILFSSISGCFGNAGQADYSSANAFIDAFAGYRTHLAKSGQRSGVALSVNWPLWKSGGMHVDEKAEKMMLQASGMIPMRTQSGIDALYKALGLGKSQAIVMEGILPEIVQKCIKPFNNSSMSYTASKTTMEAWESSIEEKVQSALINAVSKLLGIRLEDIDISAEFSEYGFDSIIFTEFSNLLNQQYGLKLTPAIFYEYPTLEAFSNYLAEEYSDVLCAKLVQQKNSDTVRSYETEDSKFQEAQAGNKESIQNYGSNNNEPVAIVGISGIFPMAADINEFWKVLSEGKDCITEIPKERWDWKEYYGDPNSEENKTNVKWGGFIEGIDEFDPLFFGISPLEAEFMDPQQRLLMTYVWKALEDAGCSAQSISGTKTGLFVGTGVSSYSELISEANMPIDNYTTIGLLPSIGPNRMSYFLNIHGASEPVETACSSSLVAIHRAFTAIRNGSCDMAIAGGINTLITPSGYISNNKAGMLCLDGRCKSFSDKANGYVRGEGAGMIFMKKLKDAEKAGDHIYGVILGTAENHGGRANSLTSPNPKAQAELLETAYRQAGIDPRTVTYIEAHGTGTKLGDPIEINGLKAAFKELYKETGSSEVLNAHCGIGSVKTNIGHLELAAGAAGIIKVLLQLKYKRLAKSLHCDTINPYIDLEGSPFYILQQGREWTALKDENGKEIPRRAGVSSFGIGGVNAHIVIEEYIAKNDDKYHTDLNESIIVLSAKNEDRLKDRAVQLLKAVKDGQFTEEDLPSIAYTLQIGREAMEERMAMTAGSISELEKKLEYFINNESDNKKIYRGRYKNSKDTHSSPDEDNKTEEMINNWLNNGEGAELLDCWSKGMNLDWNRLYIDKKPPKISLPTYMFEKERYWVSKSANKVLNNKNVNSASEVFIHPMVHRNTSDLLEQRFTSVFTGEEFFLRDHLVQGKKILPGVAYLEMARAAVEQAALPLTGRKSIKLKNIVWSRPVEILNKPVKVHVGLYPENNGDIAFEIYSEPEDNAKEDTVYSQGSAVLVDTSAACGFCVNDIKSVCNAATLSSSQCYALFKTVGVDYGATYRGIKQLYVGDGQVLAELSLPEDASENSQQFVLHPGLMDSALQAVLGFAAVRNGGDGSSKPSLAFALDSIEIYKAPSRKGWALVKYSCDNKTDGKVQKFDIDLLDENGDICVRMKGYSTRSLDTVKKGVNVSLKDLRAADLLTSVWDTAGVPKGSCSLEADGEIVLIGGNEAWKSAICNINPKVHMFGINSADKADIIAEKLRSYSNIQHIIWIASDDTPDSMKEEALIQNQEKGIIQIFRLIKALISLGYDTKQLELTVITFGTQPVFKNNAINPTHSGIHGLIGSMAKEYINWKIRLVDIENRSEMPVEDIFMLPADRDGNGWAYRAKEWFRQKLIAVKNNKPEKSHYRNEGVYVIIGGSGGIGEVWSEYMLRTYNAAIVWIGRREMNAVIRAKIDRLSALGQAPYYIQADASDRNALQKAYDEIKTRFSKINGVIHSAVGMMDKSLANMDEELFRAGLSAKIDVSVRIAQVFGGEPLDFIMFFSSAAAFAKIPGQSSYASGCNFSDAYAYQLAKEASFEVKVVNWGYWGDIGIGNDIPDTLKTRLNLSGMGSIGKSEGMEVLEELLSDDINQYVYVKTTGNAGDKGNSEFIEAYAEEIQSDIQCLKDFIPEENSKISEMKNQRDPDAEEMDELAAKLLLGQLQSIGLFTNGSITAADTKKIVGDLYQRWMQESIRVLESRKLIRRDGESYCPAQPNMDDTESLWNKWHERKSVWNCNSDIKAHADLLEATLKALPQILTGKFPATDVMFPNSSMKLVEGVYKNNAGSDYFNEVLADALTVYIEDRLKKDPSKKIKIIEIGAGTGGTSAIVLKKLKAYSGNIGEYCYTDLSKAFLLHAQDNYGPTNPFLTYKIFNVEEPAEGQDIATNEYDIAIATNVLHATKSIRRTLRNVKAVLKNNGLVMINEMSGNSLFTHLTFGLLEGWWLYEDKELRIPGCPGLFPETWKSVLESEGYRKVLFPAKGEHKLGQQVIIAQSDGIAIQKLPEIDLHETVDHRAEAAVSATKPYTANVSIKKSAEINEDLLKDKAVAYFKKIVGDTLKIPYDRIDSSEQLEAYGIDSILVVHLTNALKNVLDDISSTLFFEYQTIDALAEHFISTQRSSMIKLLGINETPVREQVNSKDNTICTEPAANFIGRPRKRNRFAAISKNEDAPPKNKALREPIAIIGLSGRYPKAKSINDFWNILENGEDCITEIPEDHWPLEGFYHPDPLEAAAQGKCYCKYGGFLENGKYFDPLFFNISPREANNMDPQERLFLETCWEVLEDAGYTREQLASDCNGRVGVFAGITRSGFSMYGPDLWKQGEKVFPYTSFASVANRVSYLFNLHGPSMPFDTMCSSSLTAVHEAFEHLQNGDCDMAIVGGVNVYSHPSSYVSFSLLNMLSPDGRCRGFGSRANGFVPGEGVGAILLKRLPKAIEDNDNIYAVIRGTSVNHGGKTNGYTVPNPNAQTELIRNALERSGADARAVSYIEAHGTGTELGDPIEISGLTQAFSKDTKDTSFCSIGTVKSNIGHLEGAAGIAGITKILLQMKNKKLAPSLFTEELNPGIEFEKTPFKVQQKLEEWKRPVLDINGEKVECPRMAGVSSFGAGGANAHVIIEEYIAENNNNDADNQNPKIIVLSAKTEKQLKNQAERLLAWLGEKQSSEIDLANVAYTLQIGREAMEERMATVVCSVEELCEKLEGFINNGDGTADIYRGQLKRNKELLSVFAVDEDMQKTVDAWIEKGKYTKLLELWVKGMSIDWHKLYGDNKPHRISLPTYPFEREKYWLPEIKAKDNDGQVRELVQKAPEFINSQAEEIDMGTLIFEPYWEACEAVNKMPVEEFAQHLAVLCNINALSEESLKSKMDDVGCINFQSSHMNIGEKFADYGIRLFEQIQTLLKQKNKGSTLIQVVIPYLNEYRTLSGMLGMLKTAMWENPKIIGQLIEVNADINAEVLAEILKYNASCTKDSHIRYEDGRRYVATLREIEAVGQYSVPWKAGGIYLVTGGAGGLGLIFAKEIVSAVNNAVIILTGRSELSEDRKRILKELESKGATVEYIQADVSDRIAVDELIQSILKNFGQISGIIHSAGIISDNFIIKKNNEEFLKVLAPKVLGLVNLDEATKTLPLDFFAVFSSTAGVFGNMGQADYCSANAFMDAYAEYRNELTQSGQRSGRTLAVNWPLWKNGGMHIDKATEMAIMQSSGMCAMEDQDGIQAFYKGITFGKNQVAVMSGYLSRIRSTMALSTKKSDENADSRIISSVEPEVLKEKVIHKLKALFSEISGMNIDRIDMEEPLESYGIDSILITQLNKKLADVSEDLSKTIFYEYKTLGSIAACIVEEYEQNCIKWVGIEARKAEIPKPISGNTVCALNSSKSTKKQYSTIAVTDLTRNAQEPIAIIGLSGQYPDAPTLQDYWNNLEKGKDCITEIPPERWSIDDFYHRNRKEAAALGKSYSKWGGFVKDFAEFDPLFFNIPPREVMNIDPQERLFIKACWEVLEDSGYTRETLEQKYNGNVGVFVGITKTGFELYGTDLRRQGELLYPFTSFGSMANRVSYLLNLHGPSMPIDTMCSSSLTAVHEACEHIRSGSCNMAIAGGVNLYLHPETYILTCAQQMLSPDGRCKSFGKGGNGYVPGEGAGAVMLKSLSRAIEDNDRIYAVIKGSNINHGGKTNGYTVPNPNAQAELIRNAIDKAGINARVISYIEAHGTGTELGDPIEIKGLTQAFRKDTADTGYCAIGSVKSNIGHLEAAAGIAGITKIIMQMQHNKIVPSLHSTELNPNIDFGKTPFVVQQELQEWKRPTAKINGEIVEYPRIAGISSFGAGGSNAHIIIEEYMKEPECRNTHEGSVAVILSARTEERLKEQAVRLLSFITGNELQNASLADIAYTLQVGREAMEHRIAIIAASFEELTEKLREFAAGQENIRDFYHGKVKRSKEELALAKEDKKISDTIDFCIANKSYRQLLEYWVDGISIDWNRLYSDKKPCRISLPTYPFEKETYWLPKVENKGQVELLHPLLHRNTSDLWEQRFSSVFTGEEFFLRDHVVNGKRILPGVAYLEMARAAVERSAKASDTGICLKNIVWARPVTADSRQTEVNIGIFPENNGDIGFEIYSVNGSEAEPVVHSQGSASLIESEASETLDITSIKECCSNSVSSYQCYEAFKTVGIDYGPGHRAIEELYVGKDQVLAKLSIPDSFGNTLEQFVMHPGLADSALQASIGLALAGDALYENAAPMKPYLPFALDEIKIMGRCTPSMWSYVRYSDGGHAGDTIQKLDIDLCDYSGNICVQMKGFTSRRLDAGNSKKPEYNLSEGQVSSLNNNTKNNIQKELAEITAELLNVNPENIDPDTDYSEYGLDRVMLVELAGRLNGIYTLELTETELSQYSTLNEILDNIILKHQQEIELRSGGGINRGLLMEESKAVAEIPNNLMKEKTVKYLKQQLSSVLQLPVERIEADAPMEKYGIDSIISMQLVNQLEKSFGSLPKTLFFEYQNIEQLTDYFVESYRAKLVELLGITEKGPEKAGKNQSYKPESPAFAENSYKLPQKRNLHSRFVNIKNTEQKTDEALDIAIIGVAGKYPQARNVDEFWQNLKAGKDCITEIPTGRWDHSALFDPDRNKLGKTYTKWGGFIDDVDKFDPLFFNISPREAEIMDPQERLFLQCAYSAIDDSGYTKENLGYSNDKGSFGNVGVFVGVMYEEYQLYGAQETIKGIPLALSGSMASIANRVSYFCNFHGPSIALDTMCSSSLTTIHLACQSLQKGECRTAIAGGVNVSIHPNKYLLLSQGKFASSKGLCESFGEGGDGYVPGEGVGAVVLKPLSEAIADKDNIYGVIKASAVNHGGKTNGYTVPNPNAQAEVLGHAFNEAGINPRTISYIEAHGTGTSLGDPIEISGLSKAFGEYTKDKQFCAIGSAKSNIGHCESAAGIAAVTKVILQLKHKQIAPSIHSEVLNPYIDFCNSPFRVQQELSSWERPVINNVEIPRRAGISSFGAGGANAHIVIEEYIPDEHNRPESYLNESKPAVIVLSARNEARLREKAQQLVDEIRNREYQEDSLKDIAYTLQTGREAMEERIAMTVESIKELLQKLTEFLNGNREIDEFYSGNIKRSKEAITAIEADEDMSELINMWISKEKYGKILDLWVKGYKFDWNKLSPSLGQHRISLPAYPFAKESYWVPQFGAKPDGSEFKESGHGTFIHPMLHSNTSDFVEQRFSSCFTGQEFFLNHHVVKCQRILPGVAYLEMAREAIEQSAGAMRKKDCIVRLTDFVWIRPIIAAEQEVQVNIGLRYDENRKISYRFYSNNSASEKPIVFSQGKAELVKNSEIPALDIDLLKKQCNRSSLDFKPYYDFYRNIGLEYGPSYQCVNTVFVGDNQILSELSLPSSIADTEEQFVIHPSMMDSALHSFVAMSGIQGMDGQTGRPDPMLPFAMEELKVFGKCTSKMWAWVKQTRASTNEDKVIKMDVDLCDQQGHVCIRIKGLSGRALKNEVETGKSAISSKEPPVGNILMVPMWNEVSAEAVEMLPSQKDKVFIIGGTKDHQYAVTQMYPDAMILELSPEYNINSMIQKLEASGYADHIIWISTYNPAQAVSDKKLIDSQNDGVISLFRLVKALVSIGYGERKLGFTVITTKAQPISENETVDVAQASIHGFAGTMAKEYSNWMVRLVDVDIDCDWPVEDIFTLPADRRGHAWVYRKKKWYRREMIQTDSSFSGNELYKKDGVYVVLGGAGGVGDAWTEYMIRTYNAKIIWIGRRQKDDVIESKLNRLSLLGNAPCYISADAANVESLEKAYKKIKESCGSINGIVHSTLVFFEQRIKDMEEESFKAALCAKVDVSVTMAEVFKHEPLDFVLFFSSIVSMVKNPGQSGYAAGCTFKDAFAHQLSLEWPCKVKIMNWGYWYNAASENLKEYQLLIETYLKIGIGLIEPAEAMKALDTLMAGPMEQIAMMKTTKPLAIEGLNLEKTAAVYPEKIPSYIKNIQSQLDGMTHR